MKVDSAFHVNLFAAGIIAPTGAVASRILVARWRHERVCVQVAILGNMQRAVLRC